MPHSRVVCLIMYEHNLHSLVVARVAATIILTLNQKN